MPLTEEILTRAARGEQTAFTQLVREHQSMVYSLAYHSLRDQPVAEELAQEVFLQLYRSLSKIESLSHLKFWLRRVTANRCIDSIRSQANRTEISWDELPEPVAPLEEDDPMLAHRLQLLVASLPQRLRLVVTLRFQEDLQLSEIAEVLEMPINTVKSHLRRALELLHGKLNAMEKLPV